MKCPECKTGNITLVESVKIVYSTNEDGIKGIEVERYKNGFEQFKCNDCASTWDNKEDLFSYV